MIGQQKIRENIKKKEKFYSEAWEELKRTSKNLGTKDNRMIARDDDICRDEGHSTDYDSEVKYGGEI